MTFFRHRITGLVQDLPDHFRNYDYLECVEEDAPCADCTMRPAEPEEVVLTEPEVRTTRRRKRS